MNEKSKELDINFSLTNSSLTIFRSYRWKWCSFPIPTAIIAVAPAYHVESKAVDSIGRLVMDTVLLESFCLQQVPASLVWKRRK